MALLAPRSTGAVRLGLAVHAQTGLVCLGALGGAAHDALAFEPSSIISQVWASWISLLVIGRAQRGLSIAAMEFMPSSQSWHTQSRWLRTTQ
ncbi:hypothetical protein [Mycobacteroides abscessus]|uniref:hypothetical protein n=1 Tax=Mycobacteroides abscessus TaxID=36809 RepID=UPI000697BA2E|nr:hypothetical protein [Mycobacteroides abscessus]MDO3130078.1 hypothetical protein [Mycobacteroides abscessus subsp. bolletii]